MGHTIGRVKQKSIKAVKTNKPAEHGDAAVAVSWYHDIIKDMCGVGGTSRGDPMGAEGGVGGGQRSGELSVTLCFSLSGS